MNQNQASVLRDYKDRIQVRDGSCWQWVGGCNEDGYGVLRLHNKGHMAHRFVYEKLVATVPKSLVMDHLCRNRACVNPEHMEPVTQRTNLLRGEGFAAKRAAQTHCIHGHEFIPENTYVRKGRLRQCKECAKRIERARAAKKRTAAPGVGT